MIAKTLGQYSPMIQIFVMKYIYRTVKASVTVNKPICIIVFWIKVVCNFVSKYQSFGPQSWRHTYILP
jgi:hypothetical protein